MPNARNILIRDGMTIDGVSSSPQVRDILILDGVISESSPISSEVDLVLHADGKLVCPGLIDMHVHLREPGQSHKETLSTGTESAIAGGFSAVACMPNTIPPLDTPMAIQSLISRIEEDAHCRVYPVGCLTRGRSGKELVDFEAMMSAGAIAFSDDGEGLVDRDLMTQALRQLRALDGLLIQHCEDPTYGRGIMHEGAVSRQLCVPGMDPRAEEDMLERDLKLAEITGARYHVAHISTAKAVALVREAKHKGLSVSAEVCPHHLLLTDEACRSLDPNFKMHPPLRTADDVRACLEGVVDGTIDILVTDHAPHTPDEKLRGFTHAPAGVIGLETALSMFAKALVEPKLITWNELIAKLSTRPAELLRIQGGRLTKGAPADITIIDPDTEWIVDATQFKSKARNCPFHGWEARAKVTCTIADGKIRFWDKNRLPVR